MKNREKLIVFICMLISADQLIAQYVGFGTASPVNPLTVNGMADFTENVGIGISLPLWKLDVNGDAKFSGVTIGRGGNSNISNSIIGHGILANNTMGEENTGAGFLALTSINTGYHNTAAGAYALNTNTTGSENTALGLSALSTNTTGSGNTAIGFNAGVASDNLMNATAIGANTIVSSSNSLVIGNNANVGIGTSNPASRLDIVGSTKVTNFQMTSGSVNGYLLISDASGNATWTDLNGLEIDPQVGSMTTNMIPRWNSTSLISGLLFDNGTNIGLGTTSPGVKFDVRATGNGIRALSGATGSGNHTAIQLGRIATDGSLGVAASTDNYAQGAAEGDIVLRTESSGQRLILNSGAGAASLVVTNSKTGIGMTAPLNRLDIEGALAIGASYAGSAVAPTNGAIIEGSVGIGTSSPLGTIRLASVFEKTFNSPYHMVNLFSGDDLASNPFSLRMTIDGDELLSNRFVAFQTGDINASDGGNLILQRDGGRVGIGRDNPEVELDVYGGIRTKYSGSVVIETFSGAAQDYNLSIDPPLPGGWDFGNTVAYVHVSDNQYGKILKTKVINSSTIQVNFKVTNNTALTRFNWIVFKL